MNDVYVDVILLEEEVRRLTEENNILKMKIEGLKELLKSEEYYD